MVAARDSTPKDKLQLSADVYFEHRYDENQFACSTILVFATLHSNISSISRPLWRCFFYASYYSAYLRMFP